MTAIKNEGDENLTVQVIPQAGVELPIEILSIIPATISLAYTKPGPITQKVPETGQAEEKVVENIEKENAKDLLPQKADVKEPEGDNNVQSSFKILKNKQNKRKLME